MIHGMGLFPYTFRQVTNFVVCNLPISDTKIYPPSSSCNVNPGFISPWAVDGLGAPFLLANEIIKNGGTLPGNQPQ